MFRNLFIAKSRRGQLLLEVLFAVAVGGAVFGVIGGLIVTGLSADKVSVERDVAGDLLAETFTAVRASAFEKWTCGTAISGSQCTATGPTVNGSYFLYDLAKGSGNTYYPAKDPASGSYQWIQHSGTGRWGAASVTAVSALSSRDVWIGADNGQVWRYNGETWSDMSGANGPTAAISDIAVVNNPSDGSLSPTSARQVWVTVPSVSNVYKWENNVWSNPSVIADARAVSAPDYNDAWVDFGGGWVCYYNGSWDTANRCWNGSGKWGASTPLNGISAFKSGASNSVWIAAGNGNVWNTTDNGSTWTQTSGIASSSLNSISVFLNDDGTNNIWVAGDTDVTTCSGNGIVINKNRDTASHFCGSGGTDGGWGSANLKSISLYFVSPSPMVAIAGASGNVWTYNGLNFYQPVGSSGAPGPWGNGVTINDVSDRYSSELWVVGTSGNVWQFKGARWVLKPVSISTDDDATLNNVTYSRNFYVQNVCRNSSDDITGITDASSGPADGTTHNCASSGGSEDPSTQKIIATVSWGAGGGNNVTASEYVTRWKNMSCLQTAWSTSGSTSAHVCPTVDYDNVDGSPTANLNTGTSLTLPGANLNGTLTSTVFDTTKLGTQGEGPAYNFIYWEGHWTDGSKQDTVKFQIASSDNAGGPWTYYSGACVSGGWSVWSATSTGDYSVMGKINCAALNNKRYFKYKLQLCHHTSCNTRIPTQDTPVINDVVIGWSP